MAQVALKDALAGQTAREIMLTFCPRVSPGVTLEQLVDQVALAEGNP